MALVGYPPSHRNLDDPQPEVCDLCGLEVGGRHLVVSEVEGMVGRRICDVTPSCRRFRNRLSYNDRRRMNPQPQSIIGQTRVYQPGAAQWYDERISHVWSTPQALSGMVAWFRNDDIPYTGTVTTWPVVYGLSPSATQTTAASRPSVVADPFGEGYRGIEFETTESLTLSAEVAPTGAFTYVAAFLTPAVLASTYLIQKSSSTSGIRLLADGSVTVSVDGGATVTVAAAGSILAATEYILTVIRESGGDTICRRNGTAISTGNNSAGTMTISTLGNAAGGGMTVTVAEEILYSSDHQDDIRELERTLAHLVGVSI